MDIHVSVAMPFSEAQYLRFEEIIRQHWKGDDSFSDESLPDPEDFEIEVLKHFYSLSLKMLT